MDLITKFYYNYMNKSSGVVKMPKIDVKDENQTEILNVIDNLDMGLHITAQSILDPAYQNFPFLSYVFFDIPLGNFIMAILVFLFFLFLRRFFTLIIIGSVQKAAKHTVNHYDDRIILALKGPMRFTFILIGLHLFFLLIFKETQVIKDILSGLIIYTIFWTIISIVDALRGMFQHATGKFNPDLAKEMGEFILKIVKIFIGSIGLAAILQIWGINVTALIASLGLGGLAFALAAKDTASNLFASFALLADKSIRIGEWIKVKGIEGRVEDIGMRTTKIRSFQKSLITVPNQILANNPIENFSRRGIRRIKMHIGLTCNTTTKQVTHIISEIEQMLHSHEGISQKDTLLVHFDSFGDSSLNILIYTFTATSNWKQYLITREDIHIKIMHIVEKNNSGFAFPSQSIYVESVAK